MPACSDCGVERAREAFSAAQLKKKSHQGRRCQLCVAQRELTPPLPSGADEVAHALSAASEAEREEARLLARLEAVRASKEAAHARAAAAKLSSDGTSVDHAPAPPGSSSVDALVVQTPESHQPTGKRLTLQTFVGSPNGAARGGGGSPVDADSLAALPTLADSDSPKEAPLLLRMTVEIGNGRTGEVKVKRGDAPDALAATFCATHGLGERAKALLTDHIATNLADVLRQRASAAANAAPPLAITKPPPTAPPPPHPHSTSAPPVAPTGASTAAPAEAHPPPKPTAQHRATARARARSAPRDRAGVGATRERSGSDARGESYSYRGGYGEYASDAAGSSLLESATWLPAAPATAGGYASTVNDRHHDSWLRATADGHRRRAKSAPRERPLHDGQPAINERSRRLVERRGDRGSHWSERLYRDHRIAESKRKELRSFVDEQSVGSSHILP